MPATLIARVRLAAALRAAALWRAPSSLAARLEDNAAAATRDDVAARHLASLCAPPPRGVGAAAPRAELLELLADLHPALLREALDALLPDLTAAERARTADALGAALGAAPPARRAAIVTALGRLGHPPSLPVLLALPAQPEAVLLAPLCEALGRFGDPAALPALEARLDHPRSQFRAAAALAIGHIPGAASERALCAALQRRDEHVHSAALAGLERVGSRDALPALHAYAAASEVHRSETLVVAAAIHKRLGTTAEPGALALAAGPGDGGLAVAEEAGRVALAGRGDQAC